MIEAANTKPRVKIDEMPPLAKTRSPLGDASWRYVGATQLEELRAPDWAILAAQRPHFNRGRAARDALALLDTQRDDPSFGYQTNMYRHCLESASRAWRDGADEEFIVICLLHDIGYTIANPTHGEFAAALLRPFISEAHTWMLRHHQEFQAYHCHDVPGLDRLKREAYRGHPSFELTARFIERYDQNTTDPNYDTLPVQAFEPLVHRLFDREPHP